MEMDDYFNIPLVLNDYKDLIPNDYNDRPYYEGKPVEGVIFVKEKYRYYAGEATGLRVLVYRIPHKAECMCLLNSVASITEEDEDLTLEREEQMVRDVYAKYIKDNIKGIHCDEYARKKLRHTSEIMKIKKELDNLDHFKEKYGIIDK